jgi:peptidoglycan/LPS O-acetylase OafA/YrhL
MERDALSSSPLAPYQLPTTSSRPAAGVVLGVLSDLVAVGLFVLIGRHSHHETDSAPGILTTAWPFAIGVLGGYVPVVPLGWPVTALRSGLVVLAKTVVLGMILRAGVQHEGTPFSFVVVTVVVLGVFMLGWRLIAFRLPVFRPAPIAAANPAQAPSIL